MKVILMKIKMKFGIQNLKSKNEETEIIEKWKISKNESVNVEKMENHRFYSSRMHLVQNADLNEG